MAICCLTGHTLPGRSIVGHCTPYSLSYTVYTRRNFMKRHIRLAVVFVALLSIVGTFSPLGSMTPVFSQDADDQSHLVDSYEFVSATGETGSVATTPGQDAEGQSSIVNSYELVSATGETGSVATTPDQDAEGQSSIVSNYELVSTPGETANPHTEESANGEVAAVKRMLTSRIIITSYDNGTVDASFEDTHTNLAIPPGLTFIYWPAGRDSGTNLAFDYEGRGTCQAYSENAVACQGYISRLTASADFYNASVDTTPDGFVFPFYFVPVAFDNEGEVETTYTAELVYPDMATYLEADVPPTRHTGNTLTWSGTRTDSAPADVWASNVTFQTEEQLPTTPIQRTHITRNIITSYSNGTENGSLERTHTNLAIPSGNTFVSWPVGRDSGTNLVFDYEGSGTCWAHSDNAVACEGDISRLTASVDYSVQVDTTPDGFVSPLGFAPIAFDSEGPVETTYSVEMIYPSAFTYLEADVPPTQHTGNTLTWSGTRTDSAPVDGWGVYVTFQTDEPVPSDPIQRTHISRATITSYNNGIEKGLIERTNTNLSIPSGVAYIYWPAGENNGPNLAFDYEGSGSCWTHTENAVACQGYISRLTTSVDYSVPVDTTPDGFVSPFGFAPIVFDNEDTVETNYTVELIYPDMFTYLGSDVSPTQHTGNTLIWSGTRTDSAPVDGWNVNVTFQTETEEPPTDTCTAQLDVMLVLDTSGSIDRNEMAQMKDFAINLVNAFDVSDTATRFGIVRFGSTAQVLQSLSGDRNTVYTTIQSISARQNEGTDIGPAVNIAHDEFRANGSSTVPQVMILLSDGANENATTDPTIEAQQARADNITIISIAVGDDTDEPLLKDIASDPDDQYFFKVDNFDGLNDIVSGLAAEACQELAVQSMTPNQGFNNEDTPVTISGTGFAAEPIKAVQLSSNGVQFALTMVSVSNDTLINATVPPGLPLGTYDLKVTNEAGASGVLEDAFTIVEPPASGPEIEGIRPAQGRVGIPNDIAIFGSNFAPGAEVTLGNTPISTFFSTSFIIYATVPGTLPAGVFDLTVTNPDGAQATLPDAYTNVGSSNNDLYAYDYDFWVDPQSPLAGDVAQIGLLVHRLGGKRVLTDVKVRFVLEALDGTVLGEQTIPFLDPPTDRESTQALDVTFPQPGTYTVYAIIDPENEIAESNEDNNIVQRTVVVGAARDDTTPPVVLDIRSNADPDNLATSMVELEINAIDPNEPTPSAGPVRQINMVEYTYSLSAEAWVPGEATGWLPHTSQVLNHTINLNAGAGMRYVQVRARDSAGNTSIGDSQVLLNHQSATNNIHATQHHVYRHEVAAGESLRVDLEVLNGDADLFVWSSDPTQSAWVSNLRSGDERVIVPADAVRAGVYQVEVHGYTAAEYRLTVSKVPGTTVLNAEEPTAVGGIDPSKTQPGQPAVSISDVPKETQGGALMNPPEVPQSPETHEIYLPLIRR
jgi:uncharacterized protein YegL